MGIGRPKNKPVNSLAMLFVSIRPAYDNAPSIIIGTIITVMATAAAIRGGLCALSLRVMIRYANEVKIPA
jgi:hypothetical protein